MSPIDNGATRVFRDADSFLRNERGLKSMAHLAVMIAMLMAVVVGSAGLVGFFLERDGATQLVTAAVGLAAAASGLEGWQTHTEGRNQRSTTPGQ